MHCFSVKPTSSIIDTNSTIHRRYDHTVYVWWNIIKIVIYFHFSQEELRCISLISNSPNVLKLNVVSGSWEHVRQRPVIRRSSAIVPGKHAFPSAILLPGSMLINKRALMDCSLMTGNLFPSYPNS